MNECRYSFFLFFSFEPKKKKKKKPNNGNWKSFQICFFFCCLLSVRVDVYEFVECVCVGVWVYLF